MATTTRVDKVVDELLTRIATATGLQTLDGPTVDEPMHDCVVVGLGEDRPGYETTVTQEPGMGRPRMREDFTVNCTLTLVSGTTDMAPLRARAALLVGLIDDALRDVHRLPGVWERAGVTGGHRWGTAMTSSGALVVVVFAVQGSSLL